MKRRGNWRRKRKKIRDEEKEEVKEENVEPEETVEGGGVRRTRKRRKKPIEPHIPPPLSFLGDEPFSRDNASYRGSRDQEEVKKRTHG